MNGLLHNLGWNDYWQEQWDALVTVECRPARVTREDRGQYQLVCAAGDVKGELSGKMRNTARSRSDLPAVGDWVAVRVSDAGEIGLVEAVLSRTSAFIRKAPGGRTEEQIVAANIDVVFLVMGLDHDYNVRRLERYLTLAWDSGASPVIV
ncbi:MAG TPA: GTPase RsgA, partial [Candidatus Hydrogenedentes bacterium]|nr:GTPase RsgA [Candidatus Hydrogenedentota bacterium]